MYNVALANLWQLLPATLTERLGGINPMKELIV
jgi:hypothetical protein